MYTLPSGLRDHLRKCSRIREPLHDEILSKLAIHHSGEFMFACASALNAIDPYFPPGNQPVLLWPVRDGKFIAYWLRSTTPPDGWRREWGYWHCPFCFDPDLKAACARYGVHEGDKYHGPIADVAKAVATLDGQLDIPEVLSDREATIEVKGKRVVIRVEGSQHDDCPWVYQGKHWTRVVRVNEGKQWKGPDFGRLIRAAVAVDDDGDDGEHEGFYVFNEGKSRWDKESKENCALILRHEGLSRDESEIVLGGILFGRLDLTHQPFKPEIVDGKWNRNAPQLKCPDWQRIENPRHPWFDRILSHVGQELDDVLPSHPWGQRHGINSGRGYLRLWIAAMIREPFEPLPYLFLHGPENSGKSILHEAIGRLISGGICYADKALTTTSEFNGELANAVLAVVEETDVSRAGNRARNRMKDWVTSDYLNLRKMHVDAHRSRNSLHFIQCSNNENASLVSFGDTRTTVLHVPMPDRDEAKQKLKQHLEREAADFTATLMRLDIPAVEGRLTIPAIDTSSKESIVAKNDPLHDIESRLPCPWNGTAIELLQLIGDDSLPKQYASDSSAARALVKLLKIRRIGNGQWQFRGFVVTFDKRRDGTHLQIQRQR